MEIVYLVGPVEGAYKIGRSNNPDVRVAQLNLPVDAPIVATIVNARDLWLEGYMHRAFAPRRVRGEWFRLTDDDIALFRSCEAADSPNDLPAAIVAMHDENSAGRRPRPAPDARFTTARVYATDGDDLATLASLFGATAAEVFREVCTPILRERLLETVSAG